MSERLHWGQKESDVVLHNAKELVSITRSFALPGFVGWVERSDTHQFPRKIDGYRYAPPILLAASQDEGFGFNKILHDARDVINFRDA